MINIKRLNKNQVFFANMLARKIAPKIVSLPNFFICFYFIGAGGDENQKDYLAWPQN